MKRRGRPKHPDILTPREWQVLELIRAGLSNEEIARRLGISLDGAKFHVSEILGKLALDNRVDAARWRPEQARPWWTAAAAPLALWRKTPPGWLSPALAGGLALAIAASVGVLIWALLSTRGGDGAPTAALAPGDRVAYIGTDGNLWALIGGVPARRLTSDPSLSDSAPAWSPDGTHLLFVRTTRFPPEVRSHPAPGVSLWLADAQSGEVRRLALAPAGLSSVQGTARGARWSPDGRRIAFLAQTGYDAGEALWVADLSGNVRQLVGPAFGVSSFSWSAEGDQLAVTRSLTPIYPESSQTNTIVAQVNGIYVIDAEGREPKAAALLPAIARAYEDGERQVRPDEKLLSDIGVVEPSGLQWSPDGTYIAFQVSVLSASASADGEGLFTVPAAGGTPVYHGRMLLSWSLLDWFPASHRFVFTLGSGRDTTTNKSLAIADAGVAGAQVIAEEPERAPTPERPVGTPASISIRADSWPAVAPDGSQIVFQASEASLTTQPRLDVGKIEGPREGIWVVNADGSNPRQLTSDPNYLDFFPQWSADGQAILFVRTNGQQFVNESTPDPNARAELWIMHADGTGVHPLVDDFQRIGSYYGLFGWESELAWYRAGP